MESNPYDIRGFILEVFEIAEQQKMSKMVFFVRADEMPDVRYMLEGYTYLVLPQGWETMQICLWVKSKEINLAEILK